MRYREYFDLGSTDRFYVYLLDQMRVLDVGNDITTIGVNVTDNSITLAYNPIFFEALPDNQKNGVLKHECMHIIFKHVIRCKDRTHERWNIACDLAINQLISRKDLPDFGVYIENYPMLETMKTAEYYYERLPEDESDKHLMDDHGNWGNSEKTDKDAERIIDNAVSTAINKSQHKGDRSPEEAVPTELDILKSSVKPLIKDNWQRYLLKINGKKQKRRRTIYRRDRRSGTFGSKGKIRIADKANIVLGIDVSGSMDTDFINRALKEVDSLLHLLNINLYTAQIDTNVTQTYLYKRNSEFRRIGGGGTYMGAMPKHLNTANQHEDVLLMISDMQIEDIVSDHNWSAYNKPVIWLACDDYSGDLPQNHKVFILD